VSEYRIGDRYRLSGRIAVGGMGEVWRGTDELLGREVAVKLLSAAHAGDEAFRMRFRAEARYAASLSHPCIARIYDYGETSEPPFGGAYLVMELVDGEPLSAVLARYGQLSAEVTLDIIGQSARALFAAHEAGIVHRDIKPGNLLVMADGTTKITDFGIATAVRAAQAHLTQTGMVMGTAMYVSPEQATGGTVSSASDIYSLGVVAYECLAGRPPFTAEQPLAIAVAHIHDPVPALPGSVPRPVSDLVMAMLAKNPAARPETAQLVADRAYVLRDSLPMMPANAPGTRADFHVAPDFASSGGSGNSATMTSPLLSQGKISKDTERVRGGGHDRHRRRVMLASTSAAVFGVAAVVAVMLSANHPMTATGDTSTGGVGTYSGAATTVSPAPAVRASHGPPPAGNNGGAVIPTHAPPRQTSPVAKATTAAPKKSPTPTPTATGTPTQTATPTPIVTVTVTAPG
jgi:serine/threonine-protein kinase